MFPVEGWGGNPLLAFFHQGVIEIM